MKVERSVNGNLDRQSLEGRLISSFRGEYPLNSKGEWGQNLAQKLVVGARMRMGEGNARGIGQGTIGSLRDKGEMHP